LGGKMRVANWVGLTFSVSLMAVHSMSCSEIECEETLTCESVADAGANDEEAGSDGAASSDAGREDASHDGSAPAPICSATPTQGCVPAEVATVFVDPNAEVNGDGSALAPVRTLREAIGLARTRDAKRIISCNGVYDEHVDLTDRDTIEILQGGFDCGSWSYNPEGETLVRSGSSGFALRIAGFAGSLVIADITFEAAAAVEPGESSIAAFISGSNSVQLRRTQLLAHDGQTGADGALEAFVEGKLWPTAASLNGNWGKGGTTDESANVGGEATELKCPGGATTRGGYGGENPEMTTGESGLPDATAGQADPLNPNCDPTACMVLSSSCQCVASSAIHGSDASAEPAGSGARSSGTLSAVGWVPSAGIDGAIGEPGGGGAGGNGSWGACDAFGIYWFGGGGGAAGGCGGNGGTAGNGGGASIALLVLDSQVAVARSTLLAGDAGDGGKGAPGQEGQAGGTGGGVDTTGSSGQAGPCGGGNGGKGGKGGAGGGGAGGISTAVAWSGNEPTIDASTALGFGEAGAIGVGGVPGGNDGIAGVAENMIQIKGN
jgi:hypothetical protein